MSDEQQPPQFHSKLMPEMLKKMPEELRGIYELLDIHSQQNDYIIRESRTTRQEIKEIKNTLKDGEKRFEKVEGRVTQIEKFKDAVTSKWSVVTFLCGVFAIPLLLQWLSSYFTKKSP